MKLTGKQKIKKVMKEIWHTTGKPNYSSPVIVIDKEGKVVDFGFYDSETFKPGDRWAYMNDLIFNSNLKRCEP